jgi:hypothetical protein
MRLVLLVALGLAALSTPAHAHGYCEDEIATKLVVDLETLAKGKDAAPDNWGDCVSENIAQNKKLEARLLAACTTILATNPDNSDCVVWSVQVGAKTLGKVDLFERAAKLFPIDAFDGSQLGVFVALDDARALPLVRDAWARALADKRYKHAGRNQTYLLAVWFHAALSLFASRGGADDAKFLAENLTATNDKGVRRGMHRAIDAITKREKSAATKPSP